MDRRKKRKTIGYETAVAEVRKACRQFAMLYFHFSRVLVEEFGELRAKQLIQKAVFELGIDRSSIQREQAKTMGLPLVPESVEKVTDIPFLGWVKEMGRNYCPYAETWMQYYDLNPWFTEIAPFYCDVIDTTNIENFSRTFSQKITRNVLKGDDICDRIYFQSENVKAGTYTYGKAGGEVSLIVTGRGKGT